MKKFFTYLDRYYVRYHNLPPLDLAGLTIFKELIFDEIKVNVTSSMLVSINLEREGQGIDRDLIRSCVELYEVKIKTIMYFIANFLTV